MSTDPGVVPIAADANTLWIVRHADAQPATGPGSDFERPLSSRGVVDCARLGTALAALSAHADRIVASDARRTRATAELLAPSFGCDGSRLFLERRLYAADVEDIFGVLRETPADVTALVLVGHNPGVSELAARLLVNGWRHGLPPLGAVCAALDAPWQRLAERSGRLAHYLDPESFG
jgi:phosphohistidine phosphatase